MNAAAARHASLAGRPHLAEPSFRNNSELTLACAVRFCREPWSTHADRGQVMLDLICLLSVFFNVQISDSHTAKLSGLSSNSVCQSRALQNGAISNQSYPDA